MTQPHTARRNLISKRLAPAGSPPAVLMPFVESRKWGGTSLSLPRTLSGERRKRVEPTSLPRTRIRHGRFFADIIEDRRDPRIFFSIVQRSRSREVLFLGQSRSRLEAEMSACSFLADHTGRRATTGKRAA